MTRTLRYRAFILGSKLSAARKCDYNKIAVARGEI
jgi:hypothetical protein